VNKRNVITCLRALRLEIQDYDPDVSLLDNMPRVAVMFWDVCRAVGLSESEINDVLGEKWESARLWRRAEETTAVSLPELAAVPV
jgi:hypothetical protein